jgi:hypothetical protein
VLPETSRPIPTTGDDGAQDTKRETAPIGDHWLPGVAGDLSDEHVGYEAQVWGAIIQPRFGDFFVFEKLAGGSLQGIARQMGSERQQFARDVLPI